MATVIECSLIDVLRARTRDAHERVEAIVDLDRRLRDRAAYGRLLQDLQALHAGFERALAPALPAGWPPPARGRALAGDLAALGLAPPAPARVDPAALADDEAVAGCLYVIEGSARGGRVIAARAASLLGDAIPRAGLCGDRHAARRWRALVSHLEALGAAGGARASERCVAGALAAFATFGARLGPPPEGGGP